MGLAESRPRWQTAILVILFIGALMVSVYTFHESPLILGMIFACLGVGLSSTAWREETRQGKLARLFMGPMIFTIALYTLIEMDVASIPAVVFWLLTMYYGFSDLMSEDPLDVDDRTGNQR